MKERGVFLMGGLHVAMTMIITIAWPFFKEWLLGLKNHPYNEQRNKSVLFNQRNAFLTSIVICINLAIALYTAEMDKSTLKKELEKAKLVKTTKAFSSNEFKELAQLKYDVAECNTRLESTSEANKLLEKKFSLVSKAKDTLELQMATQPSQCELTVPEETQQAVSEVDRSLEEIRNRLKRLKDQ